MAESLASRFPDPAFGKEGFEGSISNLSLSDVIQLQGQNRFSGSIAISYLDQEGHLFFQDGEIVHAESGSRRGEEAIRQIVAWPGGSFTIQPNVRSLGRTIHKRLDHLLLDAHQWLDESRRASNAEGLQLDVSIPAAKEVGRMTIAQKVRAIPGVSDALLMDQDGTVFTEDGRSSDALAAKSIYLASMITKPLGEAFNLGDLQVASVYSSRDQLLIFHSRDKSLCVSVEGSASLGAVETNIRKVLAARQTAP